MSPDELEQPTLLHGDVTDLDHLEQTIRENGITHVIHLAAMLVPLVKADPTRGAAVNVVGTTNVFEAAKRQGVRGIAYASSAAVYGPASGPRVEDAGEPTTLYGVFKLANEGTAKVYFEDDGVGSVGLRPYVVYGPGRDQGLTADPTLAMEAAARGEGYEMRWGGRCQLQYAADAARIFIAAARAEHGGAAVFNLGGPSSHAERRRQRNRSGCARSGGAHHVRRCAASLPGGDGIRRARGRRRPDRVDDASRRNASNDRALPRALGLAINRLARPPAACHSKRGHEGDDRHGDPDGQRPDKALAVRIEGGGREECRPRTARNEGYALPEVRCCPRADEAANEGGNRGDGKRTGGSDPQTPSSVLSREPNGSRLISARLALNRAQSGYARGVAV